MNMYLNDVMSIFRSEKCGMDFKRVLLNLQRSNSAKKVSQQQSFSSLSPTSFYSWTLMVIFIGLFIFPLASSRRLTPSGLAPKLSEKNTKHEDWNTLASEPHLPSPSNSITQSVQDLPKPKLSRRLGKKRRNTKCPKHYRNSYCMNGGTCEWIAAVHKPSCRCPPHWSGKRCVEPWLELSRRGDSNDDDDTSALIAVVLSISAVVFGTMMACICWRKCKTVRKQLKQEDMEMEKQGILTEKQSLDSFSNGPVP